MAYEITVVDIETKTLLVAKGHTTLAELPATIGGLLGEVWDYVNNEGIAAGLNVVLYPVQEDEPVMGQDSSAPVEAGIEFASAAESDLSEDDQTEATEEVSILPCGLALSSTPVGHAATTTHWGAYSGLVHAHAAVQDWCQQNDLPMQGTNWEIYGHWSDDPTQVRTDVIYLLKS